jgi:serine/threonine protein kinase
MEKYRLKEAEAHALNDFLLPMLNYYPEKRASAQQMLNHYWLSMPANPDYHMSEREYERMLMIKKAQKKDKTLQDDFAIADVIESSDELNQADDEDNSEYVSDELEESEDGYLEDPDLINIQNFNNSFAAYGQHVNLAALDRANPQFDRVRK